MAEPRHDAAARARKAMKRTNLAVAAIIAAGMMILSATAGAEPLKMRIGWVVTPGHLAPLIEELGKRQPGVFKHLGQSYIMEAVHFQGTTPEIQAQAINDLE